MPHEREVHVRQVTGLLERFPVVAILGPRLRPHLFAVLRVLAGRRPIRARFLVLGGASPDLLRQSSETLAGRIAYELPGFSVGKVGAPHLNRLWVRGGFPRAFL